MRQLTFHIHAGTKHTAYFRGRKLCGHAVHVPEGYRGVVGARQPSAQEDARQRNAPEEVVDVDADVDEQVAQRQQTVTGGLAVLAEFDEIVVWGHHSAPDAATDAYMRGVDEWLALAEQVGLSCSATGLCRFIVSPDRPASLLFTDTTALRRYTPIRKTRVAAARELEARRPFTIVGTKKAYSHFLAFEWSFFGT